MMPHKDPNLEKLAEVSDKGNNPIVYRDNLDFLTDMEIEGYENDSTLLFLGYRDETNCTECIKGSCTVPVKIAEYPDGRKVGVYSCPDPDEGGRFEVDIKSLRYWEVNVDAIPSEDVEVQGDSKPKPVKKPSKEAIQAYQLYNSAGFSQAKVAEIMTKQLKPSKPIKQWKVSRWIKECTDFLEANNLRGFSSVPKPGTVVVDPEKLNMGARTDGKVTGDPRHKKLVDPDNAAYDD